MTKERKLRYDFEKDIANLKEKLDKILTGYWYEYDYLQGGLKTKITYGYEKEKEDFYLVFIVRFEGNKMSEDMVITFKCEDGKYTPLAYDIDREGCYDYSKAKEVIDNLVIAPDIYETIEDDKIEIEIYARNTKTKKVDHHLRSTINKKGSRKFINNIKSLFVDCECHVSIRKVYKEIKIEQ